MSGHKHGADAYNFLSEGAAFADPGDAGTLKWTPGISGGYFPLVTTGAETRTLPDPDIAGLELLIYMETDGGNCVITASTAYDETGGTTLTFSDVGQFVDLVAVDVGSGTYVWRVRGYDGVTGPTTTIDTLTIGGTTVSATAAELNRVADASARIVTTTATALSLTVADHGERLVLINTNSTVANTFTLPTATGSGVKMHLINNVVQTQGTVVVAANGTDVIQGFCFAADSTAGGGSDTFATSATSDKVTLNLTTTGGLGGDSVEAWDIAANTWQVQVRIAGSGTLATPFSAT